MTTALRRDPPESFTRWLRERRERPAATAEPEFVHLVDYVMPGDVFASPMEYLVPGPRSRALESVQEAADRVARAAHVLGPAAVTADLVALARRAEWRTVVAMVNQRRAGARDDTDTAPTSDTPDAPAHAHGQHAAALIELGACADQAVRAHRRLEELGGVPDTGPAAVLRSVLGGRRAVEAARLQRERRVHAMLQQAAALRRHDREHTPAADC